MQGCFNAAGIVNGPGLETVEYLRERIDQLGGPKAYNHDAVGWAHAMCTPYQWTKQVGSHWGGTRNGTIVCRTTPGSGATATPIGPRNENRVLNLRNKSHSVTAELAVPDTDARGVIVNQGGTTGGWTVYVKDGWLCYGYSFIGLEHTTICADTPLPAGDHQVRVEFAYDGGGLGKGGTVTLYVDGQQVASGRVPRTHPLSFSLDETTDVGRDTGAPVSPDYPRRRQRLHRHRRLGPPGTRRRQPRPPHRRPRPAAPRHDQTVGSRGRSDPQRWSLLSLRGISELEDAEVPKHYAGIT